MLLLSDTFKVAKGLAFNVMLMADGSNHTGAMLRYWLGRKAHQVVSIVQPTFELYETQVTQAESWLATNPVDTSAKSEFAERVVKTAQALRDMTPNDQIPNAEKLAKFRELQGWVAAFRVMR